MHYKTVTCEHKATVFPNASVGMPVLSANCVAREGNDLTYRAEDEHVTNMQTGKLTPLPSGTGVILCKFPSLHVRDPSGMFKGALNMHDLQMLFPLRGSGKSTLMPRRGGC